MNRPVSTQTGFTLIELSIVLVIIGLLVGVILVGRDLIRAAELRSVVSDIERFRTAVNTFKVKYNCLPGDCANATDFWGSANPGPDHGCVTPETDVNPADAKATCNGGGNGLIADNLDNNLESFRFWQHLSNAELIPGHYTGVGGPCCFGLARTAIPGVNVPAAKLNTVSYSIAYTTLGGECSGGGGGVWTTGDFLDNYFTALYVGGPSPGLTWRDALSPIDSLSLDQKVDDGKPGTGIIRGACATTCSDTTDTQTAIYSVAWYGDLVECHLLVNLDH